MLRHHCLTIVAGCLFGLGIDAKAADAITSLQKNLSVALHAAACLDPTTGDDLREERKQLQRRQKELHSWFLSRDRRITLADCKTEKDRSDYHAYRRTMANFDLLRLPTRERRRPSR